MPADHKRPRRTATAEDEARGNRIATLIEDQGWTSARFAEELGISRNAMTSLTRGYSRPADETLQRICELCRIYPEWLLFGREPKRLPPGAHVPKVVHSLPVAAKGHRDLSRWLNGTAAGKATTAAEKRWLKSLPWPDDRRIPDGAFASAVLAYRQAYGHPDN